MSINGAVSQLSQELGRAPRPSEIAQHLDVPVADVLEGLEASEAYRSSSLDEMLSSEQGSATVGELVGEADAELDRVEFRQALRPVLAELPERERTIVMLRFFGNLHADPDRRRGRHLADARVAAAVADPRPAPGAAWTPRRAWADPRMAARSAPRRRPARRGSARMAPCNPSTCWWSGAGLAGLRTAEQLRAAGHQGRISLVGAETLRPLRPPAAVQAGAHRRLGAREDRAARPRRARRARRAHAPAARPRSRCATASAADRAGALGRVVAVRRRVVVATGLSRARCPASRTPAHTLRTLDDSLALRDRRWSKVTSLLVVGAGFIGAEVASAAHGSRRSRSRCWRPRPRLPSGRWAPRWAPGSRRLFTEAGVDLRTGVSITGFVDRRTPASPSSSPVGDAGDRRRRACVGIGGRPDLDWLDEHRRSTPRERAAVRRRPAACRGCDGVWAVGDVAAWADDGGRHRHEHWTSARATRPPSWRATSSARTRRPRPCRTSGPTSSGSRSSSSGGRRRPTRCVPLHGTRASTAGRSAARWPGYLAGDRLVAVAGFGAARFLARYRALVADGRRPRRGPGPGRRAVGAAPLISGRASAGSRAR